MPKETGIIMSGDHPKLILDGIKTQTRRVIKGIDQECDGLIDTGSNHWQMQWRKNPDKPMLEICNIHCPYGQVGDRLWVKETYAPNQLASGKTEILYRADGKLTSPYAYTMADGREVLTYWKPSIHMPPWASRILLEITEVWVERLQEITDGMARCEGVDWVEQDLGLRPVYFKNYKPKFIELWDSLNAKRGFPWTSNPFVWVISFRRIQ